MITLIKIDSPRANQLVTMHFAQLGYRWLDDTQVKTDDYPCKVTFKEAGRRVYPYYIENFGGDGTISYTIGRNSFGYHEVTAAEFLWDLLSDVIVDEDNNIESSWLIFEAGTFVEDIWHFFEEELGASVSELMYGKAKDSSEINIDVPMIQTGMKNGLVKIVTGDKERGKNGLCCQISEYQFYFLPISEDSKMAPEEFYAKYDEHYIACWITNYLNKEMWGCDREHYMYCYNVLSELSKKDSMNSNYRKYYTLRRGKAVEEDVYADAYGKVVEFDSYEAAYDTMCKVYMDSKKASYKYPKGLPIRYNIWVTTESEGNSMTQQACS